MNVRRYNTDVVLGAAGELQSRLQSDDIHWIELAQALGDMKFRDDEGAYWFLDARAGRWYRFDEAKWRPLSDIPDVLEGAAFLPMGKAALPPAPDFDVEPDEDWAQGSPIEALEGVARLVRSAYARGDVSSLDAERLLKGRYLIDNQGQFWTTGVQTGRWYRCEEGSWSPSDTPPAADSLLQMEQPEACENCSRLLRDEAFCPQCGAEVAPVLPDLSDEAYARILDFLVQSVPLPEPMTAPWAPPAGFPDEASHTVATAEEQSAAEATPGQLCPSCGATNADNQLFCSQCGVSLVVVPCPSCGTPAAAGLNFCTQCGTRLQ